jgi:uncharacterized protein (DUF4415 family)
MKARSTIRKHNIDNLPVGKTDVAGLRAMKDNAIQFDDEVPELTPKMLKKMGKPVVRLRGQRGPQKAPTKIQISLRVDRDVLEAYKATGEGYLSLMNKALRETLKADGSGRLKHARTMREQLGSKACPSPRVRKAHLRGKSAAQTIVDGRKDRL